MNPPSVRVEKRGLTISGWLDSLLMGFVIAHTFTYWQFIKTDPKHVVALVVGPPPLAWRSS